MDLLRQEHRPGLVRFWHGPTPPAEELLRLGLPGRTDTLRLPQERRRHPRTSPPALSNGVTYTLRAVTVSIPLVLSDLVGLLASVAVASGVVAPFLALDASTVSGLALALSAGFVGVRGAMGLYPAIGVPPQVELRKSALATSFLFGVFLLAGLVWGASASALAVLLIGGMVTLAVAPALRFVTRRVAARFRWWRQPLLVFGDGPASQRLAAYYRRRPELGLDPIAVRAGSARNGGEPETVLRPLAFLHRAVCAAVPWDGVSGVGPAGLLRESFNTFPYLLIVPDSNQSQGPWKQVTDFGGVGGVRAAKGLLFPAPRALKRVTDSIAAAMLGVLLLPLIGIIAVAIKATSRGPVFFGHQRIGRERRVFRAWKFRSMHMNADELLRGHLASNADAREEWALDQKLRDDPRLTPVGRLLRRTSLDELPQLWNVIRGEMSLVGPRPIVEAEAGKYGPEFERYMSVAPGITGLWQVSGRNNTTYQERIELDATYVESWSLTLDAYILAKTFGAVLTGEGAY